jgi:hypothetical protein
MAANVNRYWVSETEKVRYGGTKKKSKARTLAAEATSAGIRPWR